MGTIGVIVITYNGQPYISQQLESIKNQTMPPDCVLIFDDCSTDYTAKIIWDFISENHLNNWKLYINPQNIGWRRNCINAISLCDTDIIFWSDQDDIWNPVKVEVMMSVINNLECLAVYSCWDYIDQSGNSMNLSSGMGSRKIIKINASKINYKIPPLLGCSVCIKKRLAQAIQKLFPCDFDSPDWVLYRLGITIGNIYYIDVPLFKRRIHEKNVTSSKNTLKRNWKFSYQKHCKMIDIMTIQLKTLDKMISLLKESDQSMNLFFITEEKNYLYYRISFLKNNKDIFWYFFYSLKQNSCIEFINTVIKDFCFISLSRKHK